MEEHLLVYDADCGPCSKFKNGIDWFDRYNRLRYISLIDADEQGLLNSVPKSRRHKSFHLVSPEDEVSSGANAIPVLLALLPLGGFTTSLILRFQLGQRILNCVYSTLSRLHDTGSCSYKPNNSRRSPSNLEKLAAAKENAEDRANSRPPQHWLNLPEKFHHLMRLLG